MNIKTLLGLCLTPAAIFFGEVAIADVSLTSIGRYSTGVFDDSATEIATFDPASNKLFVTNAAANQVDVLNLADPTNPMLDFSIDVDNYR